jgi:signal transduction histidine kinase
LLAAERELVADLSHRLRTPLTALRLDIEAVADPATAARLAADADALERAVDDLIHEARSGASGGVTDLAAVVDDRVRFWSVLADEQGRETGHQLAPGPLPVAVGAGELGAAVDALLGNVFAHTPDGTAYRVSTTVETDGVVLVVEDDGPGLAVPAVDRGRSGGGSTGLGLDIVRRTGEAAGGTFAVETAESGGARLVLRFPR